jgi:hypothetical protein
MLTEAVLIGPDKNAAFSPDYNLVNKRPEPALNGLVLLFSAVRHRVGQPLPRSHSPYWATVKTAETTCLSRSARMPSAIGCWPRVRPTRCGQFPATARASPSATVAQAAYRFPLARAHGPQTGLKRRGLLGTWSRLQRTQLTRIWVGGFNAGPPWMSAHSAPLTGMAPSLAVTGITGSKVGGWEKFRLDRRLEVWVGAASCPALLRASSR